MGQLTFMIAICACFVCFDKTIQIAIATANAAKAAIENYRKKTPCPEHHEAVFAEVGGVKILERDVKVFTIQAIIAISYYIYKSLSK